MSWHLLPRKIIALTLLIPMLYHGLWNLTEVSSEWWGKEFGELANLRYVVGLGELAAGFGLFAAKWRRPSAAVITLLMAGAVCSHLPMGYSFKNNGFETPLAYMMIGLAIFLEGWNVEKEKSA